jgi:hypothetical protein
VISHSNGRQTFRISGNKVFSVIENWINLLKNSLTVRNFLLTDLEVQMTDLNGRIMLGIHKKCLQNCS